MLCSDLLTCDTSCSSEESLPEAPADTLPCPWTAITVMNTLPSHSNHASHIDKLTAFLGSPTTLLWQAARSHLNILGTKNGSAATANQCKLSKAHTQLAAQHATPKNLPKNQHNAACSQPAHMSPRRCSIFSCIAAVILLHTDTGRRNNNAKNQHQRVKTPTAAAASGGQHTTWPLLQKGRWLSSGPCYSVPPAMGCPLKQPTQPSGSDPCPTRTRSVCTIATACWQHLWARLHHHDLSVWQHHALNVLRHTPKGGLNSLAHLADALDQLPAGVAVPQQRLVSSLKGSLQQGHHRDTDSGEKRRAQQQQQQSAAVSADGN